MGLYRVIQWATGNTGQRALREIIRDPRFELVGVRVYNKEKDGVDAGDLCGESRTGVLATTDCDNIFKLTADCCLYMPRAAGAGRSRTGLTEDELVNDLVRLVGSGTNVATTCNDLFGRAMALSDRNRARLEEACRKGNASIWASGTDPGFVTETLTMALLSLQRRVDLIEIEEFGDLSRRPSPHMVMDQMRFGRPLADFDSTHRRDHLFHSTRATLTVLADYAGITIDEWTSEGGVAAAKHDLKIVAGEIKAGTAGAQRVIIHGFSAGVERIRFTQYAFVTMEVEPDWGYPETGWRVRVVGDAPFDVSLPFPVSLDALPTVVPAFNANGLVNAIPYLCAARSGVLSSEDLPHILPRGPRRID